MDPTELYRAVVRGVIEDIASIGSGDEAVEMIPFLDPEHDRYLLMSVGWDRRGYRVHHCVFHMAIINGKIWIQHDATDLTVADELIAAGVPREDIVLAFHPAELRQYTGFAVG